MASSLFITILASRLLSKEQLGMYFLVLVLVQVATSIGDFALRSTVIRLLAQVHPEDQTDLARYALSLNCAFAILASALLGLLLPVLPAAWLPRDALVIALYSVPITFLTLNFQMGQAVLVGHGGVMEMSRIHVTTELLRATASVGALLMGAGAVGLLAVLATSRIPGLIMIWRTIPQCIRPLFRHPRKAEILQFSGWMYGVSLMSTINARTVDSIIAAYLGIAAYATYSVALQIPTALLKVFESVRQVVLAHVSSLGLQKVTSTIESIRLLGSMLTIASAILILLAKPLVYLLFSPQYEGAVSIAQVLSLWVSVSTINYYITILLVGAGQSRQLFFISFPQFVVVLVCCLQLVPSFGAIGAAAALTLSAGASTLLSVWLIARREKGMFMGLVLALVKSIVPLTGFLLATLWWNSIYASAVLILIFPFAMFLTSAITPADISHVMSFFKRRSRWR